jgi:3-methylcrotonyl-CoA carboxylase alpha subunit
MPPFRKILIANRGEIAVRVARTCRVLGIPTVAVYSDADRQALHVREADEAVAIGPAEPERSYLNIEALLEAARRTGAEAVHPGYGFLSQNGDFADAVAGAGIAFIGPPGAVHRVMGDKRAARRLMAGAGVPVLPGYDGDDSSDPTLTAEAARIGWPLILKPARGGGGKGMRVVRGPEELAAALAASRREAQAAFGSDSIVLERFVERPRHVEVQVLADAHGAVVHVLERECSIQRRHQKVVEETPSPALSAAQRQALLDAGVAAARAVDYRNAGTVEFLLAPDGTFYFIEMNTRLQVEHPVTELVTALDLVRLQIEIAAGRPLPFRQSDVAPRGHAMECRVYAEDAENEDLPSAGRILHLVWPQGPGVRVDDGVARHSDVTIDYDPLLAKIAAVGRDRAECIDRLEAALAETVILGVQTNLARLRRVLAHPLVRSGSFDTGFLAQHAEELRSPECPPAEAVAAALAALASPAAEAGTPAAGAAAPDPWRALGAWRLGS